MSVEKIYCARAQSLRDNITLIQPGNTNYNFHTFGTCYYSPRWNRLAFTLPSYPCAYRVFLYVPFILDGRLVSILQDGQGITPPIIYKEN